MKLKELALQHVRASRELLNFLPEALPSLLDDITAEADAGQKFMQLFFILQSLRMDEFSLEMQAKALQHRTVFRILSPPRPPPQNSEDSAGSTRGHTFLVFRFVGRWAGRAQNRKTRNLWLGF